MRDEIRQALQDYKSSFGEDVFIHPTKFAEHSSAEPMRVLISCAISGMNVYSRLKNSTSRNIPTDVNNLARELRKKYFIEESAARIAIECIAELLGYIPPTQQEQARPEIVSPSINDIVHFGDYDWRVLDFDAKDGNALLLSENILEQRAYHPCYAGVTWEQSELRKYLNGDFLGDFTQADQWQILDTKLNNPDNLWYTVNGGDDSVDKIFVLNLEEADRYFGNSEDYLNKRRKEYAKGEWIASENGWILSNTHDNSRIAKHEGISSFWWLRSPGYSDCTVAYVSTTGNIALNGDRVCIGRGGVRPALWVKLGTQQA